MPPARGKDPSVESWIAASGTGMTCLLQASGKEGESRHPDPGWGLPLQILRFAQNDILLEPASVALVFESVQGVLGGACSWATTYVRDRGDTSF